jgi:hypothetical protein
VVLVIIALVFFVDVGNSVGNSYARFEDSVLEGGVDGVAGVHGRVIVKGGADARGGFEAGLMLMFVFVCVCVCVYV